MPNPVLRRQVIDNINYMRVLRFATVGWPPCRYHDFCVRPIPANLFYNIPLVGIVRNILLAGRAAKISYKSVI